MVRPGRHGPGLVVARVKWLLTQVLLVSGEPRRSLKVVLSVDTEAEVVISAIDRAAEHPFQILLVDASAHRHEIGAWQRVLRIGEPIRQPRVVGQQQEAAGREIQPAHRHQTWRQIG